MSVSTYADFLRYCGALYAMRDVMARHSRSIGHAAMAEGVDANLLFAVIALEQINRAGLHRFAERVCARLCPWVLVRADCTLGLAQIRVSVAYRLVGGDLRKIPRILTDDSQNILLCARMLGGYEREHDLASVPQRERLYTIAKLHLTGRPDSEESSAVKLYARLLGYALRLRLFTSWAERRVGAG